MIHLIHSSKETNHPVNTLMSFSINRCHVCIVENMWIDATKDVFLELQDGMEGSHVEPVKSNSLYRFFIYLLKI